MTSPFDALLATLTRQRGVTASLVVSERDGIVVDARLPVGAQGDRVAALAASLYRKARRSAGTAGLGQVAFLQLEATEGRICALGRNDLVLVVVAAREANVGLIRMEMLRAADEMEAHA